MTQIINEFSKFNNKLKNIALPIGIKLSKNLE